MIDESCEARGSRNDGCSILRMVHELRIYGVANVPYMLCTQIIMLHTGWVHLMHIMRAAHEPSAIMCSISHARARSQRPTTSIAIIMISFFHSACAHLAPSIIMIGQVTMRATIHNCIYSKHAKSTCLRAEKKTRANAYILPSERARASHSICKMNELAPWDINHSCLHRGAIYIRLG